MKTIWKYPFEIREHQELDLPKGAQIIHVGLDPAARPCLWAVVEPTQEKQPLDLYVAPTGDGIPAGATKHLATIVWKHNSTVWHVFTNEKKSCAKS